MSSFLVVALLVLMLPAAVVMAQVPPAAPTNLAAAVISGTQVDPAPVPPPDTGGVNLVMLIGILAAVAVVSVLVFRLVRREKK